MELVCGKVFSTIAKYCVNLTTCILDEFHLRFHMELSNALLLGQHSGIYFGSEAKFPCLRPLGGCSCFTFLLCSKSDGVGDQCLLSARGDTTAESE